MIDLIMFIHVARCEVNVTFINCNTRPPLHVRDATFGVLSANNLFKRFPYRFVELEFNNNQMILVLVLEQE